jgi:membrane fusion protein (multidrug efflux system)
VISRARRITIIGVVALTTSLSGWWGWHWYRQGRFEVVTDNAYLRGDITSVAPKLSGYVVEAAVEDNVRVSKGDVLFRINDEDYRAKLAQAKATVAAREADITNISATRTLQHALIAQAEAQRQSAVAELEFARANLERYATLRQSGTASELKLQDTQAANSKAQAALDGAAANIQAQKLKLGVLDAQLAGARAALAQAKASLDLAAIDLANTVVRAPVDGVVGNRQVRVGRFVTPGAAALDIVPVDDVWIVANFKETQLSRVSIGQKARITVDGYADREISGVVDSFAPGSGAAFSLLPPDNATGNFIRVVQRVPVKIQLVENPLPGRLVPGLSARVAIMVDGPGMPALPTGGMAGPDRHHAASR